MLLSETLYSCERANNIPCFWGVYTATAIGGGTAVYKDVFGLYMYGISEGCINNDNRLSFWQKKLRTLCGQFTRREGGLQNRFQ